MQNKNKKGFTLIEVLVAMFIFTLMMLATILAFSNLFKSYRESKNIQEDLDNAQYAMNLVMKSLRTSSIITDGSDGEGDTISIYDYSQDMCITYAFYSVDDKNYLGSSFFETDDTTCETSTMPAFTPMTTGDVTGNFWWVKSDGDSNTVGSVTMLMHLGSSKGGVDIQSSVSLRDYVVSGIELEI
ncbi:type II secretion system protein J [Patescibacteria group bacterium]